MERIARSCGLSLENFLYIGKCLSENNTYKQPRPPALENDVQSANNPEDESRLAELDEKYQKLLDDYAILQEKYGAMLVGLGITDDPYVWPDPDASVKEATRK